MMQSDRNQKKPFLALSALLLLAFFLATATHIVNAGSGICPDPVRTGQMQSRETGDEGCPCCPKSQAPQSAPCSGIADECPCVSGNRFDGLFLFKSEDRLSDVAPISKDFLTTFFHNTAFFDQRVYKEPSHGRASTYLTKLSLLC
jgi:hypothetical protein